MPALSPSEARLVNGRSLLVEFRPMDNLVVALMLSPTGKVIFHHTFCRFPDGSYQTISQDVAA